MSVKGYGNSNGIEKGPSEIERLRAISDFKKNVKPEEYIDQDLYGREDRRVVSKMTSAGNESPKTQTTLGKGTGGSHTRKVRFASASLVGKKVRSLFGKLTKRMDCFGMISSDSDVTEEGDVEVTNPKPVESQSSSHQDEPSVSNPKGSVDADTLTTNKDSNDMHKEVQVKHVELRDEMFEDQKDEDTTSNVDGTVDATPHRVKRKVGSGDDFSVVEKGMVAKTLTKLRSTGSFVFKESRSLVSQEKNCSDEDSQAGRHSCLVSKDCTERVQDSQAPSPSEAEGSQEGRPIPHTDSSSSSSGSATARGQTGDMDVKPFVETTQTASGLSTGIVTRLRSVFEEETLEVVDAVVENELETGEGIHSCSNGVRCHQACGQSTNDSENEEATVEGLQRGFVDGANGTGMQPASAALIPSEAVISVESSSKLEGCNVPDKVFIRRASSALKVRSLTLGLEAMTGEIRREIEAPLEPVPGVKKSKTTLETDGAEQPPLLSVEDVSKRLSGHVQRMKSLFESRSGDGTGSEYEEDSPCETAHIRGGLSCDSGVFSADENNGMDTFSAAQRRTEETAMDGQIGLGTAVATKSSITTEIVDLANRQGRDTTMTREVGGFEHERVDIGSKDGGKTQEIVQVPSVVEGEDGSAGPTIQHTGGNHVVIEEPSDRDTMDEPCSLDEPSSGSASISDDLSQPVSHLVGSCLLM